MIIKSFNENPEEKLNKVYECPPGLDSEAGDIKIVFEIVGDDNYLEFRIPYYSLSLVSFSNSLKIKNAINEDTSRELLVVIQKIINRIIGLDIIAKSVTVV
jgi:hypothetical protein